jgi:hypothetical protein
MSRQQRRDCSDQFATFICLTSIAAVPFDPSEPKQRQNLSGLLGKGCVAPSTPVRQFLICSYHRAGRLEEMQKTRRCCRIPLECMNLWALRIELSEFLRQSFCTNAKAALKSEEVWGKQDGLPWRQAGPSSAACSLHSLRLAGLFRHTCTEKSDSALH